MTGQFDQFSMTDQLSLSDQFSLIDQFYDWFVCDESRGLLVYILLDNTL